MQKLGLVVKQLTEILPLAGAQSDIGKVVLEALTKLTKLAPPGSNSKAAERNEIQQMAMKNAQASQTQQALNQGGGQGGPPGGGMQMPGMAA